MYDTDTQALVQTLSTHAKGGVGGNARGVRQYGGDLLAVVNNGSSTVALIRRTGNGLKFDRVIPTSSAPVSIDAAVPLAQVSVDPTSAHGARTGREEPAGLSRPFAPRVMREPLTRIPARSTSDRLTGASVDLASAS